jgi:hypothetical protein
MGPSLVADGGEARSVGPVPLQPSRALAGRGPLGATRKLIEGHWGIRLPDAPGAADDGTHRITRYGLPAGDLTGDGHPDAISYEISSPIDINSTDYRYSVHALDGVDGELLWSREYGEYFSIFPLATPDLTGDTRGDIVLLSYDFEGQWAGPCTSLCARVEERQHRWALEVLSGAAGTTQWRREMEGAHGSLAVNTSNIVPNLLTGNYARVTTNAAVLPLVAGDHDGDGVADLILNEFDEVAARDSKYYRTAATVYAYSTATLVRSRAYVLDGQTGGVLLERTRDFDQGDTLLLPAGNAVGSDAGDLLWQVVTKTGGASVCHDSPAGEDCEGIATAVLDLELIDGQTLGAGWATTIQHEGLIWPFAEAPRADLTGDGRTDLLLFEGVGEPNQYPEEWSMGVVSGATGTVAWRKPIQDYPNAVDRTLIGDMGGGSGNDLLDLDLVLDAGAQEFNWVLRRVDGATGEVLLTTERVIKASEGFVLSPISDVDQDGVPDVVLDHIDKVLNEETGKLEPRSTVWIESGRTGEVLMSRTEEGEAIPVEAGDLDGDGRSDLLLFWAEAGMQLIGLKAVSASDGSALWSLSTVPTSFQIHRIPDIAGGGSDLLLSRTRHAGGEHLSRIDTIDGLTGETRWARGDALQLASA